MSFVNNSKELRDHIRQYPGAFTLNALSLWEEIANINEGIAEILARLPKEQTAFVPTLGKEERRCLNKSLPES